MPVKIDLTEMYAAVGDLETVGRNLRGVVALKAMGDYIKTTPRKTGRAQSGWDVTEGAGAGGFEPAEGQTSYDPKNPVKALAVSATAEAFGAITVYNNVVYIVRLDEGWSQQAPAGMTPIVEANLNAFLRREFSV